MKKIFSSADINEPKYLVRRRIGLVRKLNDSHRNQNNEPDELVNADGRWYAIPGRDYQWLRCYLLLTCFDMLGQLTTEWADFYSWLTQKMNVDPGTLASVEVEKNTHNYQTLYHSYNRDIATRNNFYHFINTVISEQRRTELLNSIIIIKKDKLTDATIPASVSNGEKLNFLFNIRNAYISKEKILAVNHDSFVVESPNDHYFILRWNPTLLLAILEDVLQRN